MRPDFEVRAVDGPRPEGAGERVTVQVRIPTDVRYVEGHFEHEPILPGVAQLVGLVLRPTRKAWPSLGPLRAMRRLKFMQALRPDQEVDIQLDRDANKVRFEIARGGEPVTRGVLVFEG
ncbi:MAG: hypothetical protein AB7S26_07735 [Sandaracinaceae bacterium]